MAKDLLLLMVPLAFSLATEGGAATVCEPWLCWHPVRLCGQVHGGCTTPGLENDTHMYSQKLMPMRKNARTMGPGRPALKSLWTCEREKTIAARISTCARTHIARAMRVARFAARFKEVRASNRRRYTGVSDLTVCCTPQHSHKESNAKLTCSSTPLLSTLYRARACPASWY